MNWMLVALFFNASSPPPVPMMPVLTIPGFSSLQTCLDAGTGVASLNRRYVDNLGNKTSTPIDDVKFVCIEIK